MNIKGNDPGNFSVIYLKKRYNIVDFVFFAFSALCMGFVILLLFLIGIKKEMSLRPLYMLVAAVVAAIYYYLEVTFFSKDLGLYYLSNLVPQGLLLILLGMWLLRRELS